MGQTNLAFHWNLKKVLPISALLAVAIGLALRAYWILIQRFSFDSDEAIVGLMAKHIIQGERPIFFYGQAYMGSLDAWIISFAFHLFGHSVDVMRWVQTGLWILLLVSLYFCARHLFSSSVAGWWAVLLFSLPPVNQVLYSTVTLGGYNEALIIGVWCIFVADRCKEQDSHNRWKWCGFLGLLTGFGLWVFGFSLLFSIPAAFYVGWRTIKQKTGWAEWLKNGLSWLVGASLGMVPMLVYFVLNGIGAFLRELTGSAVDVQTGNPLVIWATRLGSYFFLGLPAAFGLRPPWAVQWLMLPLIPLVLIGWGILIFKSISLAHRHNQVYLLFSIPILLLVVFTFTSFGVDPSGRYFLPVFLVGCLIAAGVFSEWGSTRWYIPAILTGLFVIFHLGGTIQASVISPDGLTPQFAPDTANVDANMVQLKDRLSELGISTGFTDYWTAYPLAFLSNEEQIFIPRLPYHHNLTYTLRDDRYLPYTQNVYQSTDNAFITHQHPELDQLINQKLIELGVTYKLDDSIPGYKIYFDLSSPVTPEELGLGEVVSQP